MRFDTTNVSRYSLAQAVRGRAIGSTRKKTAEEAPGIAILAALLEQFPVIAAADEEVDSNMPPDLVIPSAAIVQPIDLETWINETTELHRVNGEERQRIGIGKRM